MSSPVSKLNRFSRLFSSKSINSPILKFATPKSDCSSDLSVLPDELVRYVETPSTSRSPTLCSTPAGSGKNSMRYNCQTHLRKPYWLFGQGSSQNLKPFNENKLVDDSKKQEVPIRNRRLGVSGGAFTKQCKKLSSQGSICNSASESRKCNVYSASVVPNSITCNKKMSVHRLGGITLSPTSVSFTCHSPFLSYADKNRNLSPTFFLFNSAREDDDEFSNGSQIEFTEQCPPEKLYYWEENEDEIVAEENIGQGGFGSVFKGTYRGEKVAIKMLQRAYKSRQVFNEAFQGELLGLRLRHPNIVRTLMVIQASDLLESNPRKSLCYVVMEHAGDTNLYRVINDSEEVIDESRRNRERYQVKRIKKQIFTAINSEKYHSTNHIFAMNQNLGWRKSTSLPKNRFCCHILHGLTYLHRNKLAHLDLKPSNVIVTLNDNCKLCDFGSCSVIISPKECTSEDSPARTTDSAIGSSLFSAGFDSSSAKKSSSHLMGTIIYRAPELLRGFNPELKSDVYSFGITAWQIWSRYAPYTGQHYHTVVYRVVALGLRPTIPQKTLGSNPVNESSLKFFDILTSCWHAEICKRPTAEEALSKMKLLVELC